MWVLCMRSVVFFSSWRPSLRPVTSGRHCRCHRTSSGRARWSPPVPAALGQTRGRGAPAGTRGRSCCLSALLELVVGAPLPLPSPCPRPWMAPCGRRWRARCTTPSARRSITSASRASDGWAFLGCLLGSDGWPAQLSELPPISLPICQLRDGVFIGVIPL